MKLQAKQRLRASEDYGWYILSEARKVLSGPYPSEEQAHRIADLHHNKEIGIRIEYGCEENEEFESLSQYSEL